MSVSATEAQLLGLRFAFIPGAAEEIKNDHTHAPRFVLLANEVIPERNKMYMNVAMAVILMIGLGAAVGLGASPLIVYGLMGGLSFNVIEVGRRSYQLYQKVEPMILEIRGVKSL